MARPRIHDADTADALVAAAATAFRSGGPDAVRVRAVAEEVGVSTRAVYSLFGSREDLIDEVYRRGFAGLAMALGAVAQTDTPLADLRALGEAYRASARARPNLYHAMFPAGADHDRGAPDAESRPTFEVLVAAVTRCVEAGMLSGEPVDLARQLWALTHGLVLLELAGSLGPDPDAIWDQALPALAAGHAGPGLRGPRPVPDPPPVPRPPTGRP